MGLNWRTAALASAAIAAAVLAAPAYASCTAAGPLVSIPATTTVNGVNDTFTGLAFSIDGAIDGDGLFFQNAATGDPLTIVTHAPIDSTTGAAGNEGIFIAGDFGDICYDGDAGGAIKSLSDGLSIDQFGDGDVLLTIAHTIDAAGSAVLVTHEGSGNVSIRTSGSMSGDDAGIAVDHSGASGDVDITTASGTTIVATGGVGPAIGPPGPTGIAVSRETFPGPGTGNININNGANIVADTAGIATSMCGCVGGTTTIKSTGDITAQVGIISFSDSAVSIAALGGTIAADAGIVAFGDNVDVTVGSGTKIHVNHPSLSLSDIGIYVVATGAVHATIAGTVEAATGQGAVYLLSDADIKLTLEPGYAITGLVGAFGPGSTHTLDFGGDIGTASFDLNNVGPYPQQYIGFDTFEKTGSSTWSFTGSSFAGELTVKDGTARINDAIPGLDVLLSGGAVGGNGSFRDLSGSGIIAPGNSIGTMTVATATIGAGSVYQVELDAAGASDKLIATGAAAIDSAATVLAMPQAGSYGTHATTYTILTADGGITGGFGGVSSVSPYFTAVLSADAKNVYLSLTPQLTASGDGFASLSTAMLDDSRYLRDAVLERLQSGRDTPSMVTAPGFAGDAAAPDGANSAAWARTYGGLTHLSANGSAPSVDLATGGLILGGDASNGNTRLGALFSSGISGFSVPERDLTGSTGNGSAGVYGGADWDSFYLSFGSTFTLRSVDTTRQIVLGGGTDTFRARYNTLTAQGFVETGYTIDMGAVSATPFAGLAAVGNWTPGFTETGPAGGAVTASPSATSALISTLGLRLEHQFMLGDNMLVTLSGSAGWRHVFAGTTTTDNSLDGFAFEATGAPLAADALLLTAGADIDLSETFAVHAGYSGLVAAAGGSYALTATLTGKF